jgi:hypothetical protein
MDDAIKAAPSSPTVFANCRLTGGYLLILHPQGQLTDLELAAAGVSTTIVPEVRAIRNGDEPAIYAIANGPAVSGIGVNRNFKSTWTTAQNLFVRIDRLLYLPKTHLAVVVTITGPAGARVIDKIE